MRTAESPTDPARILIATAGTWGDLLPFVELGRRLRSRGHCVTVASSTGHHAWVKGAGLLAAEFDGDFGKEKAQKNARCWDQWMPDLSATVEEKEAWALRMESNCRKLALLARDSDLLLSASNCPEGRIVHEETGIPWVSIVFIPEEMLGAKPSREPRSEKTIFAWSKALGRAEDPLVHQTGFWFYEDPRWEMWRPGPSLLRFMEEGEAPLVLSFSSLPLENPRKVLEIHVRAAQLLGRRLVVQEGWSGFSRELLPDDVDPDQVYLAEFLPHDWFFSRAGGLITHGGAGTLGRALRNGCPVLVEPYGNDQFFNALLMKKMGFGTAVHPHRISPERLAEVIEERLFSAQVRERAKQVASIIRDEGGVVEACEIIERRCEEDLV